MKTPGREAGLTIVEVLVATMLLAIVLVPALDALYTGMRGRDVHATMAAEHYSVLARMELILAEPYTNLLGAAAAAGNFKTPTAYSDPAGPAGRRVVYVALYDADNADGDANGFTVPDPNSDGDNDPYTGYSGTLWVRVEAEGSTTAFESLAAR